MEDELKTTQQNEVLKSVDLPEGSKPIGYKLVYKTKKDSKEISTATEKNLSLKA